jgi:ornithine--oxo-acid transaminase
MWAIELGEPEGGPGRAVWRAVERRQPGLGAQLLSVPLFTEHRILTQAAGHRMSVVKILPPLVMSDEDLDRFVDALEDVVAKAERPARAYARFGWTVARSGRKGRRAA